MQNYKSKFHSLLLVLMVLLTASTFSQKVIKEEKIKESKSSKYGERTEYKFTFENDIDGILWQAKSDGKWWGKKLFTDVGPFTKKEAIKWLWELKKPSSGSAGYLGSGGGGGGSSKVYTGSRGGKYTIVNGKKRYLSSSSSSSSSSSKSRSRSRGRRR
jgi:hypothetical protein